MKYLVFVAVALAAGSLASSTASAETIRMQRTTPYADSSHIARKIRKECVGLQDKLSAYAEEFGREFGVSIQRVDKVDAADPGAVLVVEITEVVSRGNPFIGHRKYSEIEGTLYRDGEKVAGFVGARNSMGGAFAGYKGSCSVLGRTMKALGKDVAEWLTSPEDGDELGDY
ncbi:MAG: hypothetical protein KDI75_06090 [Xanthomonadales bacterium]|nr:hypothetical protein [Xanthomonadales bacterium]